MSYYRYEDLTSELALEDPTVDLARFEVDNSVRISD